MAGEGERRGGRQGFIGLVAGGIDAMDPMESQVGRSDWPLNSCVLVRDHCSTLNLRFQALLPVIHFDPGTWRVHFFLPPEQMIMNGLQTPSGLLPQLLLPEPKTFWPMFRESRP